MISHPPDLLQLGQYQLLEKAGEGGMGTVYKAMHTKLKRLVAIKILPPDRRDDGQALARFQREMEAVGKLDHPNIIRATDASEKDGIPFLVMEFAEGLDLHKLVRRCGPLPIPEACELIRQTAVGLQYIHEHQLVHRDIKPSNVLVTLTGQVKILDLGLARFHQLSSLEGELTASGVVMGTIDFMAPEQEFDSRGVDIRADLYSLGCTLYKLLTGKPPFSGPEYDCAAKKRFAHANVPVPSVHRSRTDVPPELVRVLDRLLAKSPADRFATPAEAAECLAPLAVGSDLHGLVALARAKNGHDRCAFPGGCPPAGPFQLHRTAPSGPTISLPWEQETVAVRARGVLFRFLLSRTGFLSSLLVLAVLLAALIATWCHESPSPGSFIDWPEDYPQVLRARGMGQRIEILSPAPFAAKPKNPARASVSVSRPAEGPDLRYQPLWCRRLAGTGQYHELGTGLMLESTFPQTPSGCTFLALDNDLARRSFDFEVELGPVFGADEQHGLGAFFGWQEVEHGRVAVYLVRLASEPGAGLQARKDRMTIGQTRLRLDGQEGAFVVESLRLSPLEGDVPLTIPLDQSGRRHQVRIRGTPARVTVAVDNQQLIVVTPPFDPRGALGVWAQHGQGWFGKAAITAIDSSDDPK
jgi:hypothetical protein